MSRSRKVLQALAGKPDLMVQVFQKLNHTLLEWERRDAGKGPYWVRMDLRGDAPVMVAPLPERAFSLLCEYQWQAKAHPDFPPLSDSQEIGSGQALTFEAAVRDATRWVLLHGWQLIEDASSGSHNPHSNSKVT